MRRSQKIALFLVTTLSVLIFVRQSKPDSTPATVPDRTVVPAELWTSIDAKDDKIGKEIELIVTDDVHDANGKVLIAKHAKLKGRVTEAVPWTKDKPESKISLVVESAEWKGYSVVLHAFVAGDLKVYTSASHAHQGPVTIESTKVTVPLGRPLNLPPSPRPGLALDESVSLQIAMPRDLVTEVVSKAHTVRIEQGSMFSLRQLSP
jgi:UDP:flavonoid glycosyltransferase YjiC (YdhE family)